MGGGVLGGWGRWELGFPNTGVGGAGWGVAVGGMGAG